MKITKQQLRRIIKEEKVRILNERRQIALLEFSSNVEMSNARRALNQARVPFEVGVGVIEIPVDMVDLTEEVLFDARVRYRRS